jgi:hypothetical protein
MSISAQARAKGKLFLPGSSIRRNVHLDWWDHLTPMIMARGFREVADMAVEASRDRSGHPDRFFYPVAFLYRHYLELQLKYIISLGGRLFQREVKGLAIHDLDKLWKEARAIILEVWPTTKPRVLKPIDQAMKEFHQVDPSGQEFRYDKKVSGDRSLLRAPRIIDLDNIAEQMAAVSKLLSAAQTGIDEAIAATQP